MLIICTIIVIRLVCLTETRVFCEDSNATPRAHRGHSCPVNCHNVIYAAEKLKLQDYHLLLESNTETGIETDDSRINSIRLQFQKSFRTEQDIRKFNSVRNDKENKDLYKEFKNLMKTKNILVKLQNRLDRKSGYPSKCLAYLKTVSPKPQIFKRLLFKCSRRSNVEEEFLNTLTDILNKHTKNYVFTIEMTKELLEKIVGHNMDLRNGVFDIKKMLEALQHAIDHFETEPQPLGEIRLTSFNCLGIYVSGCFCKSGYVEDSGRCVLPSKCSSDRILTKYLPRITVH